MTVSPARRLALASVIVVVAFAAGLLVRKASAGSTSAAPLPTPIVLSPSTVKIQGVSLPSPPPALHRQVHRSAPPSQSSPGTQSPVPTQTAPPSVTPKSSTPPSSTGGGTVIVG